MMKMADRLQILFTIDCLMEDYSKLSAAEQKKVDKQVQELGKLLSKPTEDKIKHLLSKGKDMTYSDIRYLLRKDVSRNAIRKAMKMQWYDFVELIKKHERRGNRNE